MKKIFTLFAALMCMVSMYAATETVYFVNAQKWAGTINAYAWTDGVGNNHEWPGLPATKETEQIAGCDVYSYTAEAGTYANVIFNNGATQTADLTWTAGKYFVKGEWCTKEEVAVKLGQPVEYETTYFVNVDGWAAVKIYTWAPSLGDWPGVDMKKETEQIAGKEVWSYTIEKGDSFGGVIFNSGDGKQTADLTWEAGKYYVSGKWYTKEEAEEALNKPTVITYVLMGVNDDWTTGITMTVNPDNENEYMLLNQPIAEGDSVKVVTLTNGEKTAYCGNVKDGVTVTITPDDKNGNIILAPGNYDFYYDVTADNIWIAAVSETPDTPDTPDTPATYYVTGNEALFGDKAWASNAIAMTEVEGVYTHTFTAVAAGVECQLKVTNGTWDASWGYTNLTTVPAGVTNTKDNNIVFTLAEAGDVVVTFSEEKITITGNFAVSDEPQVITYVLMGVGGDWETGIALTKNEQAEGEEYQLLGQEIAEGDAVKVVTLNNGTAIAWCGNVEEASVAHTADEKGNIVLAPGKYDFYFKVNDPTTADDDIIYIGASNLSAVDNITTTVAPVKMIQNGQLVIIRNGVKYNVQGAVIK